MLRGENIACGTSTTGTGTLTCAATPSGVGALDFLQWLTAINGFTTSKVLLVPYTLIEYTSNVLAVPSQIETGIGTLTLGASIAATTLARTTVLATQTGTTYDESAPTAITIGTAANTLIFIGQNAWGTQVIAPYLDQSLDDTYGVCGALSGNPGSWTPSADGATTNEFWSLELFLKPVFAKVARVNVTTAYSGTTGVPISGAFAALYQVGSDGKPGRLLVDFGTFGANPLNSTGIKSATAAGAGALITPGEYWQRLYLSWSGATGTVTQAVLRSSPHVRTAHNLVGANWKTVKLSTGGSTAASDPANVTGWSNGAGAGFSALMGFAAS